MRWKKRDYELGPGSDDCLPLLHIVWTGSVSKSASSSIGTRDKVARSEKWLLIVGIKIRVNTILLFFISVTQKPNWSLGASLLRFLDHTLNQTHTHTHTHKPGITPLYEWSARLRGRYLPNTQETQQTNIHAFSRIRPRDPNNQAATDIHLRPHGGRDQYSSATYILIAEFLVKRWNKLTFRRLIVVWNA
jgi:hypothetical protein